MPPGSQMSEWVTQFVGSIPALDDFMRLMVNDFFIPVTACLILLGLWAGHPNPTRREHLQRTIINTSIAVGTCSLALYLINIHDFWPRPYELLESARQAMQTLHYPSGDPSFPSNVATISFAAATGVWLGHRKAGIVLYVLASIWALSRFYAGMHFFVDIAGGAAIGVLTGFIISKVLMPRTEPIPTLALRLARFLYIA